MAALAIPAPWHFFDRDSVPKRERKLANVVGTEPRLARRLVCARCRHPITTDDQQIAVNGSHDHTCTNPLGLTFHIVCFRDAPGCRATGAATTEHTWFAGYAWRIADCAQCDGHLGWLFTSSADGFYGLIRDRLVAGGAT